MKVPAKYNRNNYNSHMDLVKGGFEWTAVGISFFKHLKAGAGVEILFAFHLHSRWKTIVMCDYVDEYTSTMLWSFETNNDHGNRRRHIADLSHYAPNKITLL